MKWILIVIGILCVLFVIAQVFISRQTNQSEMQDYQVVKKLEGFEIRFYPPALMAAVQAPSQKMESASSKNFGRLAGYIFGGNESNQKIAMTSPVHMEVTDSGNNMAFVLPKEYQMNQLPKPNDAGIQFKQTSAVYMAAIQFGGFANQKSYEEHAAQLVQKLQKEGIETKGNPTYLGYNPPFELTNRRNEVVVEVVWNAEIN